MRASLVVLGLVLAPSLAVAKTFDLSTEWLRGSLQLGFGRLDSEQGPAAALQVEATPWVGSLVPIYSVTLGALMGSGSPVPQLDASFGLRRLLERPRLGRPVVKAFVGGGWLAGSPAVSVRGSVSRTLCQLGPVGLDAALTVRAMFSPGRFSDHFLSAGVELGLGF